MSRINLLPWREELRAQQKKQFIGSLGLSALGGVLVSALLMSFYGAQVSGQKQRNDYLANKIEQAEKKVEEIQELDAQKNRLLSRKEVIDTLQADRSRIVRLFESLARATPDGIVLTLLRQNEYGMLIEGRAQSNSRVSDYMRNLEASGWMNRPDLSVIEATDALPGLDGHPYLFRLSVGLAKLEEVSTQTGEELPAADQDSGQVQALVEQDPMAAPLDPVETPPAPSEGAAQPAPAEDDQALPELEQEIQS